MEGLTILTSGPLPKNPPDLLGSRKMSRIVEALRERADMVLFDSPPVMGMADASLLASQAENALLVVDPEQTKRDPLLRAKEILVKSEARVLGVVLNRLVPGRRGSYYYYYQSYYEGYGYGKDEEKKKRKGRTSR